MTEYMDLEPFRRLPFHIQRVGVRAFGSAEALLDVVKRTQPPLE